jgi:hypothetical protein
MERPRNQYRFTSYLEGNMRERREKAGDPGSKLFPAIYRPMRNILEQDVNSQMLWPTRLFIPPGSMNWYHIQLGLAFSALLMVFSAAQITLSRPDLGFKRI